MSGLAKAVGGIFGLAGGSRGSIPITPARQISTPGLQLDTRLGFLTRSGPQRELVVAGERDTLNRLERQRGDILGLRSQIAPLRAQLGPLQEQARGLFDRTSPLFGTLSDQISELRSGFGRLTEARVGAVRNAAGKAIGNVRSAFRQRNILGANFAQREIASISQEFAQEEVRQRAEAFVQEQQAQREIIGQIAELVNTDRASIAANIGVLAADLGLTQADAAILTNELVNLNSQASLLAQRANRELQEFGLAANAVQGITALAANIATVNANIAAENAANRGASIGAIAQGLSSAAGFFSLPTFGGGGGGIDNTVEA